MIIVIPERSYLADMKNIVESFYNWYSSNIRNPRYRWLVVLGTLVYLFSPLDFSTDFFPIIGWIDDGIVLTLLSTELSRLIIEYRNERKNMKASNSEIVVDTNPAEIPIQ
jgi:uncharacterized membrane protein YkvA (DUF1232 family)